MAFPRKQITFRSVKGARSLLDLDLQTKSLLFVAEETSLPVHFDHCSTQSTVRLRMSMIRTGSDGK